MTSFKQLCIDAKFPQEKIDLLVPFLVETYGETKKFLEDVVSGGPSTKWPEEIDEHEIHRLRVASLNAKTSLEALPPKRIKEFRKLSLEAEISQKKVEPLSLFLTRTYLEKKDFFREVVAGGPIPDREETPGWPDNITWKDVHRLRMASLRQMREPTCLLI